MADRDNNLGSSGSDEVVNPDSGIDENSGMSGSTSDREESDLGSDSGSIEPSGDQSGTETTGDELDSSRESGRSGSQSDGQKGGFGDPSPSNN